MWHPVAVAKRQLIQSPPGDQRTKPERDSSEYAKQKSRMNSKLAGYSTAAGSELIVETSLVKHKREKDGLMKFEALYGSSTGVLGLARRPAVKEAGM